MAKRPNQRLKLLYLAKIMLRLTDDEHGLQVEQIINELAWISHGVKIARLTQH